MQVASSRLRQPRKGSKQHSLNTSKVRDRTSTCSIYISLFFYYTDRGKTTAYDYLVGSDDCRPSASSQASKKVAPSGEVEVGA
jgi:hypothetical protein